VAHHLFESKGGGERLCAIVVDEALQKAHNVAIATTSQFNAKATFEKNFGISLIEEPQQFYLLKKYINLFGIFHRLITYLPIRKAIKKFHPESVFLDMEFIKPLQSDVKKYNAKVLRYVHFPTVAETSIKELLPEKYFRFPYNLYWKLYLLFQRRVVLPAEDDFSDIVCANSMFTKRFVEKVWNRKDVKVVYPPVSVSEYSPGSSKEDIVVSLGRFTPEKRFELAIQAISECETKVRLNLIGGLIPAMNTYFLRLKRLCKELGIEDRVRFYPNAPFETVKRILGQSKVFVHPMQNEHFGISTVEAMASGCIPINHNSGGSIEILNKGQYGFLFKDVSEISDFIDKAISDEDFFGKMCRSVVKRAKLYDEAIFRKEIFDLMESSLN